MSSLAIGTDGDLVLEGNDLIRDESLASSILVSLLCDRRAEGVRPEQNRGWWADDERDRVGSLLWLVDRAKATAETAALARDHVAGALEWLTEEGIADRVEIEAEIDARKALVIDVAITRGTAARWSSLWDAFGNLDHPWEGGVLRIRAI